jgi:RNA processing factor Prp31
MEVIYYFKNRLLPKKGVIYSYVTIRTFGSEEKKGVIYSYVAIRTFGSEEKKGVIYSYVTIRTFGSEEPYSDKNPTRPAW